MNVGVGDRANLLHVNSHSEQVWSKELMLDLFTVWSLKSFLLFYTMTV